MVNDMCTYRTHPSGRAGHGPGTYQPGNACTPAPEPRAFQTPGQVLTETVPDGRRWILTQGHRSADELAFQPVTHT